MRIFLGVLALFMAGVVGAAQTEHTRGEFRFSVGPEPGFVTLHKVPAAWDRSAAGFDDTSWRFWLYEEQIDRRGGRDHAYTDYVYEAKSATQLGEAGRFQITFNPVYQQLVIHRVELRRSGQWQSRLAPERISLARREADFEQDMSDGNVTALIVLNDVRVDDLIRVSYSVIGSNPILAGLVMDWTRLGWRSPILDSRLRVLYDKGRLPKVHRENNAPAPVIRRTADAVEVLFEMHGVAAYVDEGSYPIWYQPYPTVGVAADREWGDVVAWALPLYPKAEKLPSDLEAKVVEWSKLAEPPQRLNAALRAVQDQVRYFGVEMGDNTHRPTSPSDTWIRRYGDCKDKTYLLVTLLDRLGIRAAPALVSTTKGRAIADFPPAASVFDHVVVRAELGNKVLWLDPTLTAEGGSPSESDLSFYGLALPVAAGSTGLEAIGAPKQSDAGMVVNERFALSADGRDVKLNVETTYRGRSADHARRSITAKRGVELSRQYSEYYRKQFGELSAVGEPTVHDDRDKNTLRLVEEYVLRSPFESEGTVKALDVFAEGLSNPTALPGSTSRSGPLFFGMPARYRHEIQLDLAERWTPTFSSDALHYAAAGFDYRRDIHVDPGKVRLVFDVNVVDRDIAPHQVAGHLGELRKLRDSLSARLRFQLPAGLQRQERDTRLKALLKTAVEGEATP